jgi:hypothetical protein
MLADQVTARRIERVDHTERDDRRYRTTVEEGIGVFDDMSCRVHWNQSTSTVVAGNTVAAFG